MKKLFPLIIFCFFFGCKKPPEDKLAGKWKIDKAVVNGVDKTSELDTLHILYYEFKEVDVGAREPTYRHVIFLNIDGAKTDWEDSCRASVSGLNSYSQYSNANYYEINDEKTQIIFCSNNCTYNKSIIPMFISDCNLRWNISKWKYDDFWVETQYAGNTYETYFKKITK